MTDQKSVSCDKYIIVDKHLVPLSEVIFPNRIWAANDLKCAQERWKGGRVVQVVALTLNEVDARLAQE